VRVGRRHRGVLLAGVLGVLQFAHATTVGLHARAGLGCPSRAAGLQIRQDPYHVTAAFGPCQGEGYLSQGLGYDPPGWPLTFRLELGSVAGTPTTSLEIGAYWTDRSMEERLEALAGGGVAWTPLGHASPLPGKHRGDPVPPF